MKLRQLRKDRRGAAMVEYSLLLFVVLVVAGGIFTTLGKKVREAADRSVEPFYNH